MTKPVIGISACLLGQLVRYDGRHKADRFITDVLAGHVTFVPVCPEVECGLPVPREAMRLVGNPDCASLVTVSTGIDHTERMRTWCDRRLGDTALRGLDGFIFKARSPSCGLRDTEIFDGNGVTSRTGPGLFAAAFTRRFPLVPVEDEGALHDDARRENFIDRLFAFHRWQRFLADDGTVRGLVDFHADHKLLLMAHSVTLLRELGRIAATAAKSKGWREAYGAALMKALAAEATPKKHANALMHAMGYFKRTLGGADKRELLAAIDRYRTGLAPLSAPVTLINRHVRVFGEAYLARQVYLNRHPAQLDLRSRD